MAETREEFRARCEEFVRKRREEARATVPYFETEGDRALILRRKVKEETYGGTKLILLEIAQDTPNTGWVLSSGNGERADKFKPGDYVMWSKYCVGGTTGFDWDDAGEDMIMIDARDLWGKFTNPVTIARMERFVTQPEAKLEMNKRGE